MAENYAGFTPEQIYNALGSRYFYGLRRTDSGEVFVNKVDQLRGTDGITVNNVGDTEDNFPNFEQGQDFYEGRDIFHNLVYKNLNYEQFRWDNNNLYYYVNDEGELVIRINQKFTYDDTVSSNG